MNSAIVDERMQNVSEYGASYRYWQELEVGVTMRLTHDKDQMRLINELIAGAGNRNRPTAPPGIDVSQ